MIFYKKTCQKHKNIPNFRKTGKTGKTGKTCRVATLHDMMKKCEYLREL